MRFRVAPLAVMNLLMVTALVAIGLPGIVATAIRLPSEITIRAVQLGQPVDKDALEDAVARLTRAAEWSNGARADLGLAMLAQGATLTDSVAGDHAARQLRRYLAEAPDDSVAWSNLALAESRRGIPSAAVTAYEMSIELAPESAIYLVSRCDFGIEIFAALNEAGKTMLARQCQMAMDPALDWAISHNLVALLKRKKALPLATMLMSGDPEASRRFAALAAAP